MYFSASTGFDFQFGFQGNSSTVGGCSLYQPNGQALAEIRTYDGSGNLTKTPRSVADAVFTSGSQVVTSSTASFNSTYDLGQPVTGLGSLIVPGSVISSVDSSSQIHMSIPAVGAGSGQALTIGQAVNVNTFPGASYKRNLTFLWWCQEGWAWVMQDDQVLAEINVGSARYYAPGSDVLIQAQIIARTNAAYQMAWGQTRLHLAHN